MGVSDRVTHALIGSADLTSLIKGWNVDAVTLKQININSISALLATKVLVLHWQKPNYNDWKELMGLSDDKLDDGIDGRTESASFGSFPKVTTGLGVSYFNPIVA